MSQLVDHYARIVKGYPEKPIVIGHSLGGLITQIIVNRDLAAAGIVIHPAPTLGVFPYEFSFLKAGWKALGLFTSLKKTYLMSFKDWQYAFVNGMPFAEQKAAYENLTIPESKTVARGGLTSAAKVDYAKPHAPLLFTSGSEDNIIPAHLNNRNFKKYKRNGSILEYKEFPGRNHFVLGQSTWKEDADYILDWLRGNHKKGSFQKNLLTKDQKHKKMKRTAVAVWYGSGKNGNGQLTTQSKVLKKTQYSFNSRFAEEKGTNPEELLAAAHAGCFTMKLSFVLDEAGFTEKTIETTCYISFINGTSLSLP